MSLASGSCTSLCSSPALPTTTPTLSKQNQSLCTLLKLNQAKNQLLLTTSFTFSNVHASKHSNFIVKVSEIEAKTEGEKKEDDKAAAAAAAEEKYEEYEVVLDQPYGLKFTKGRDGGTYIDAIAPGAAVDKTGLFTVGDKVIATSAVFGD